MKVKIEVDCSPDEAREFFGLPDVRDLQQKILEAQEANLLEQARTMDMSKIMEGWMNQKAFDPMNLQSFWKNAGFPPSRDDGTS